MKNSRSRCRCISRSNVLVAAILGAVNGPGMAQSSDAIQEAQQLGSVIVTGTRATNRTVAESESPIDILTGKDLQSTGSNELATVLGRLLPSLNFPRPSVTDGTDAVRPAQLRGLSPDQTLILINGKRRHTSAVVNVNGTVGRGSAPADLNAIPLGAIERVEVLRDGAAAQYGSDAIAGVINIILKKGANGDEAQVGFGKYDESDGEQKSGSVNFGVKLSDRGWARFTIEGRDQELTNRAGADYRNPLEPRYGQVNQRQGDPDSKQFNIGLNSELQLTDEIDLYAFGNVSRRETSAAALWRTAYSSGVTLRSPLYPEGFLPLEESVSTDQSLVAGIRGRTANGWVWDASLNYGSNEFDLDINNTANLSLGAASPTRFHAGNLKNSQTLFNFDATQDFKISVLPNPVLLGVGVEAREESYKISEGEAASYSGTGSQGFSGFQPSNSGKFSRHSQSVYGSLETQLTDKFSGGLALRNEHYSDFGSATSGKLSGRYEVNSALAFRGTASTGFRAPSLAQKNYTISTTNLLVIGGSTQAVETGTFGVDTAAARALGAESLDPEKSRNLSLGALIQPSKNFSTAIDVYQIDIDKRILYSANLSLPTALQNVLAAQGVYVGAARYFTNALDTRTKGVDVVSTYGLELETAGQLDLTFGYNYNKTTVRKVADNPTVLTQNGLTLIDRQTINRATVSAPKTKLSVGAEYKVTQWRLHALSTRYGKFVAPQNDPALDQTFSSNWVHDVSASYRHGKSTFTLGVDNVTDQYPDTVLTSLSSGGTLPYSNFSPYGFNGRFFYGRVSYAW